MTLVKGGVARPTSDDTPVITAIKARRSIRTYMDVPIEWGKIISVIEAGMMAPSAGNLQIWRYTVVRNQEKRREIAEACLQQYWMEQAPAHIVIFAKLQKEEQYYGIRGTRLYSIQDCAMSAMNMMLAAQDLGLGTCFVSAFEEEALSRIFGLPDNIRAQGVLTIGYTDEKPPTPLKYRVESIIGIENYGTAMNPEGYKGGGRVAGGGSAEHNFRYAERFPNYVKDAIHDVGRATAKKRENILGKLLNKGKDVKAKLDEKAKKQ